VQTPAIRERVVSQLLNVDKDLAAEVADGLGMGLPEPMPLATNAPIPKYPVSPSLSLFARPGDGSIAGRRVAVLVAPGVEGAAVTALHAQLAKGGAVPRLIGAKLGAIKTADGSSLGVEATLNTMPAVLWDAVVVPNGLSDQLSSDAYAREFVAEHFRHFKPMLIVGDATKLLERSGVMLTETGSPGVVVSAKANAAAMAGFVDALGKHRAFDREIDPAQ
jgi:catalase